MLFLLLFSHHWHSSWSFLFWVSWSGLPVIVRSVFCDIHWLRLWVDSCTFQETCLHFSPQLSPIAWLIWIFVSCVAAEKKIHTLLITIIFLFFLSVTTHPMSKLLRLRPIRFLLMMTVKSGMTSRMKLTMTPWTRLMAEWPLSLNKLPVDCWSTKLPSAVIYWFIVLVIVLMRNMIWWKLTYVRTSRKEHKRTFVQHCSV